MDRWGRLAREKKREQKRPKKNEIDWKDYAHAKKSKLDAQFSVEKKSESEGGNEESHLLFQGLSFYINGLIYPPEPELREIIIKHGGLYSHYLSGRINYVIATNLADSKKKKLGGRTLMPSFITESVRKGKLEKTRMHLLYPPVASNLNLNSHPTTSTTSNSTSTSTKSSFSVSRKFAKKTPTGSEISPDSQLTFSKFCPSKSAVSTPLPRSQIRRSSSARRLFSQDSEDSFPEVDEPSLQFIEESQSQSFSFLNNSTPLEFLTQKSAEENFLPFPPDQIVSKGSESSESSNHSSKSKNYNWNIADKFKILDVKDKISFNEDPNKDLNKDLNKELYYKELTDLENKGFLNTNETFSECSTLTSDESSEEEFVKFPSSEESLDEISEDEDLFPTQPPIKSGEKKLKARRFSKLRQSPTPKFIISKWEILNPINQLRNEYLEKAQEAQKDSSETPVVTNWFTGAKYELSNSQLLEARKFLMPKCRPALNGTHEMEDVRKMIRNIIQISQNPNDRDVNVFLTYFTELMKLGFTANSEILLKFLKRRLEDSSVNENWRRVFQSVINEVQEYALKHRQGKFSLT